MLYLLAFFISPLALLLAGRPFQAILNFFIYVASIFGLILFTPGVMLWAIGVIHAILVIHNKRADARAQRIIDAVEHRH